MWLRIVVVALLTALPAACGGDANEGGGGDRDTMTITFERSGGFAGLARSVTVSSDSLSNQDAAELRRLIDEARLFDLPEHAGEGEPVPDDFNYVISVDEGERSTVVRTGDANAPPQLRPLLDWLNAALRTGGG